MEETDYLIIGAGPTGLGAACRLDERGADWRILEATNQFGGLAGSFVDELGFTWDLGGHVQFSHYETFDRYMQSALGADGWLTHQRESWVWIRDRFVPYPFQNNLHRLDPEDQWVCMEGLFAALKTEQVDGRQPGPADFDEWMVATFGAGISDLFMRPYNFKVWAYPPSALDYHWIGERVAVPDLGKALRSICLGEDAVSWGPNATFQFPRAGGTGAVWTAIGESLPADRIHLGTPAETIDLARKEVETEDGRRWRYHHLLSTMPLNRLIRRVRGEVSETEADRLIYSSTHVVGVGLAGSIPDPLRTKCWMYFPEDNSPYYRVTVFSNYSPHNVPDPANQWSLMAEVSESPVKPVDSARLVHDTIGALVEDRLIPDRRAIVSTVHRRLPQGYPTPFIGRDAVIDPILRRFEQDHIWSRGRFGAWKYEVSNQDHCFAQGYEWADRLLADGGPEYEPTLHTPAIVNTRRNP